MSSLGNEPAAISKAIEPFRGGMREKPDDAQGTENYLAQRKLMVKWLKTELGIEINRGGMAERIVRWAKVSSLLSKMSAGPADVVVEQTDREL